MSSLSREIYVLRAALAAMERERNQFAYALRSVMDGVQDHDIQTNTGMTQADSDYVAKARSRARSIAERLPAPPQEPTP